MKNTTSGPEDSIFRKKGFFIALYSCLGAVAVLALVITIANFGQPGFQADDYYQDAAPVGAYDVEPYRSQADEEAWFRPRATPPPTPAPPVPVPTARPTPQPTRPPEIPANEVPTPMPEAANEEPAETPEPAAEAEPPPPPAEAFTPFAEGDRLLWPVEGEIVMPFSMNELILDPTLVQFRTNDDIRIASEHGVQVQASANGEVITTGRNVVRGNYVIIDHGNGWIATYGQLDSNKLVSAGDVVRAGQIIGTVGEPSMFGYLHGAHVNLHVTRDGEPVDPYVLLATSRE